MSEFLSRLGGAALYDLKGTPLDRILNHLMGGQQGASGLEALVEKLRDGGLREQVESWISTGNNRPVAPQELERALGGGRPARVERRGGAPWAVRPAQPNAAPLDRRADAPRALADARGDAGGRAGRDAAPDPRAPRRRAGRTVVRSRRDPWDRRCGEATGLRRVASGRHRARPRKVKPAESGS